MMKHMLVLVLTAALAASAVPAGAAPVGETDRDWSVSAAYIFPGTGDFDVYGDAYALNGMVRFWPRDNVGWGLAGAWEIWNADGESSKWDGRIDGDLNVYTLDAVACWRPFGPGVAGLIFETGLRYAMTGSDLDRTADGVRQSIDVDDGVLGLLNAYWETPVSETTRFFAGAGYQMDLVEGDVKAGGTKLEGNRLEAFRLEAGFRWRF